MPPSVGRSCRGPPAGALKMSTQCQREESRRGGMFIRPKALSHFAFSCLVVKIRVTSGTGSACATFIPVSSGPVMLTGMPVSSL